MSRIKKTLQTPESESLKNALRHHADTPFEEAMIELCFRSAWYGLFLQKFERKDDFNLNACAGVAVVNNNVILYINPNRFDILPLNVRVGVLKHEALHIVNRHILRKGERNHKLFNIASDTAINQLVGDKSDLPEGVYHWDEEPLKQVPGMAPDLASEKYYDMIQTEAQKQGQKGISSDNSDSEEGEGEGQGGKCDGDCTKCPANGQDAEGNSTCPRKKNNPNANGKDGKGEGKDKKWGNMVGDHSQWGTEGDASGNDADVIEGQIKHKAKEAADTVMASGRGTVPGHVQDAIDKLGKPSKVDWRSVLRDFVSDSFDSENRTSFKRFMRRIDYIIPGKKRVPIPQFTVAVDTSGSMGDREVAACLDECEAIAEQFNTNGFALWQFDSAVQWVGEYETGKYPKIHGRGGTDFEPVIEKARKEGLRSIIIMTDGGAPPPKDYHGITVYWVLTEGYYEPWVKEFKGRKVMIDLSVLNGKN